MRNLRKKLRGWLWPSLRKLDQVKLEISKLRADIQSEMQHARFDSTVFSSLEVEKLYREVLGKIRIKSVAGYDKKRFGSESDGGYVMIDRLEGIDCAYSLGIFNEVSWDLEMASRGIPVLQYDDSIEGSPASHKLFTFYKKRITSLPNPDLKFESLEGIIAGHHHSGKNLILKMDIEGSEWEVLDAVSEESLNLFDQILVEFHQFARIPEHQFRERAKRVFEKLSLHHTPIHVHANNCSRIYKLPNFYFANILEVTYVRSKSYSLGESQEIFPGPHDRPNVTSLPEVFLGNFKFD